MSRSLSANPGPRRRESLSIWVLGARPRTLAAAVVPVAVGAATAVGADGPHSAEGIGGADNAVLWWRVVPALVTSVALQVSVNYANDLSDGVRGTDRVGLRKGPTRLVGSGLVPPTRVRNAALASAGVAGAAGLVLAHAAGWHLLIVGAACVLAAWGYTGGPWPYGYAGLGEVFVFVFFGAVATTGTSYVLIERVDALAAAVSAPVGLWSVALLAVNNLRDIESDKIAGKRTLAVRLGRRGAGISYAAVLAASYTAAVLAALSGRATWAALVGAPLAVRAAIALRRADTPDAFAEVLATTGRLQIISGAGLAAGLALTG